MTDRRQASPRSWLRWLGTLLALLCIGWVGFSLVRGIGTLADDPRWPSVARATAALAPAYALAGLLLAIAWRSLVGAYGANLAWLPAIAVFAQSQVSKYLPGNVVQYASRQVLGRRAGASHAALVVSAVLELTSLMAAAALLVALAASTATTPVPPRIAFAVAGGLVVAAPFAWPVLDRLLRRTPLRRFLEEAAPLSPVRTGRMLALSIVLHLLFFAYSGILLFALLRFGWQTEDWTPLAAIGLFAGAWMAGTVSVGAPAGAGVREALLALALEPALGGPAAAAAAVSLRVVTTGGDLLLGGVGVLLDRFDRGGPGNPGGS